MPEIKITITNKKAAVEGAPVIVCGNSDYTVTFTFDDEWAAHNTKTARFVYRSNGVNSFQEKVFTGTTCEVPVLYGVDFVLIGVYAGNLRTSSPAKVTCFPGILDGNPVHQVTEDVYHQMITMFDTRLPADTAWHNATANALKGSASGEMVTVTDASPIEHEPSVWVHGENLYVTDIDRYTRPSSYFLCPVKLKRGQKYCLSGSVIGEVIPNITVGIVERGEHYEEFVSAMHVLIWADSGLISPVTFEVDDGWASPKLAIYPPAEKDSIGQIFSNYNIQLEEGDTATEYTPYVDPTGVKVTAADVEFQPAADGTVAGISSVDLAGGITTDTEGVIIEVEYNRDVNKALEQLTNAVISLGGKM